MYIANAFGSRSALNSTQCDNMAIGALHIIQKRLTLLFLLIMLVWNTGVSSFDENLYAAGSKDCSLMVSICKADCDLFIEGRVRFVAKLASGSTFCRRIFDDDTNDVSTNDTKMLLTTYDVDCCRSYPLRSDKLAEQLQLITYLMIATLGSIPMIAVIFAAAFCYKRKKPERSSSYKRKYFRSFNEHDKSSTSAFSLSSLSEDQTVGPQSNYSRRSSNRSGLSTWSRPMRTPELNKRMVDGANNRKRSKVKTSASIKSATVRGSGYGDAYKDFAAFTKFNAPEQINSDAKQPQEPRDVTITADGTPIAFEHLFGCGFDIVPTSTLNRSNSKP